MKRVMFLLIGIMMAGGMAAAEATGNESATLLGESCRLYRVPVDASVVPIGPEGP